MQLDNHVKISLRVFSICVIYLDRSSHVVCVANLTDFANTPYGTRPGISHVNLSANYYKKTMRRQ